MARMTKKLITHIWDMTNACFREALIEEHPDFWSKFIPSYLENLSVEDIKSELHMAGLPFRSVTINDRYLIKVLKLTSDELSLIVEADQKGKIKRSPVTIHAILDELLHRGAHGRES